MIEAGVSSEAVRPLPRDEVRWSIIAWTAAIASFYAPLIFSRIIEPDDLLDSELVYNQAIGALWRGDPSLANAFLAGHEPMLTLSRLTQPLMLSYALLPAFPAYVLNDIVTRLIAACGAWLLLGRLDVSIFWRQLLAALFAVSLSNTLYGLSIAGLPLAAWLFQRSERWRYVGLVFIAVNSSLYLTGIFFLLIGPLLHISLLRQRLDRRFWAGWGAYLLGLLVGNAGLIVLTLVPHPIWQRAEWQVLPQSLLFSGKSVAQPLLPLFALAAALGWNSQRVRIVAAFGLFVIAWYAIYQLPWMQLRRPLGIQIDRFYFLWPVALMLICGLASKATSGRRQQLLFVACVAGILASLPPHQHIRQLVRNVTGIGKGYPPIEIYYHTAWFKAADIRRPVVSVGVDPMAAPMNGVASIDGYFPVYPLAYKHQFERVYTDPLIRRWGSKLYAKPGADFCAAREMGAAYVVSAVPLPLNLLRAGELRLYDLPRCRTKPVSTPVLD